MILALLVVTQLNGRADIQRTAPVSTVQSTVNPQLGHKQLKMAQKAPVCGLDPCIDWMFKFNEPEYLNNLILVNSLYQTGAIK